MRFGIAVKTCFRKYARFKGRASRSEYWWFSLFFSLTVCLVMGVSLIASLLSPLVVLAGMGVTAAAVLAMLLPSFAVAVRRLHDCNLSGWWLLAAYTLPVLLALGLGAIMGLPLAASWEILNSAGSPPVQAMLRSRPGLYALYLPEVAAGLSMLYFFIKKGTAGANRFGPDPLGSQRAPDTSPGAVA